MKTFVNTYLGEIYEEEQSKLDSTILFNRTKAGLKEFEIDPRIIVLTGAVDTQDDRLVIDIKGWGKNEECWTVYYKEIYGNLNEDTAWNTIKEIVERPYTHYSFHQIT